MSRKLRRLISLLLCVSTLFGALVPQVQAMPADHSAMMAMDHPDGAPCGGCDEGTPSACDEHCAALSAGMVLPVLLNTPVLVATAEPIVVSLVTDFESQAGPPGLQPPR